VPGFAAQLILRTTAAAGFNFFDFLAVYVFSHRLGYSSRARLFVMSRTSKSS
jgi:hypothetical protein